MREQGGHIVAICMGFHVWFDHILHGSSRMKTTLNLNDQLLRQAKSSAHEHGVTLTRFVEEALWAQLMPSNKPKTKYKFDPPVVRGVRPPAVDVSDRETLNEFLDEK